MNENLMYDDEAERAVLGAMLENSKAIPLCVDKLQVESFLRVPHQLIYAAIQALYVENRPIDGVIVGEYLQNAGDLNRVGGVGYLIGLVDATPTWENADYYADIIREKWLRRQVGGVGKRIAQLATDTEKSAAEVLAQSQEMVLSVDTRESKQDTIVEQTDRAFDLWVKYSEGDVVDISTGFKMFDLLTGGFIHKDFIIVGGYPSVGKSAWMHNCLYNITAKQKRPGLLLSYEDKAESILHRMVAMETGLNPRQKEDREKAKQPEVLGVFSDIQKSPLFIKDTPPADLNEAVLLIRQVKMEVEDLDVVVIDNIQLMSVADAYNSEREISKITQTLKNLGKMLDVALVAVSHLSREAVKLARRPVMSDLRYSGMAEGNADTVIFIHREDYHEYEFDSPESQAEVIVAKNRNNRIGTIHMNYNRAISRFTEVI